MLVRLKYDAVGPADAHSAHIISLVLEVKGLPGRVASNEALL